MRINWKQGLFRFWVVASIVWVLSVIIYMLNDARQFAELQRELNCDPIQMNSVEWGECYIKSLGPSEGDTWFWANLRWNWIILPGGSLLILLMICVGVGIAKVIAWVGRGFS